MRTWFARVGQDHRQRIAVIGAGALLLGAVAAGVVWATSGSDTRASRATGHADAARAPRPGRGSIADPAATLATVCKPGLPADFGGQLSGSGVVDLTKIPQWVPVGGGPFHGCVLREILHPEADGGRAWDRLTSLSGNPFNPPLPVYLPDGTLSGYMAGDFVPLDRADPTRVPIPFLEHPPTLQELVGDLYDSP